MASKIINSLVYLEYLNQFLVENVTCHVCTNKYELSNGHYLSYKLFQKMKILSGIET